MSCISQIFSDPQIERELHINGYVVVPLLTEEQVNDLTDLYFSIAPSLVSDFHATTYSKDLNYKRKAYDGIKEIVVRSLGKVIPHYSVQMANFVVKAPNSTRAKISLHQDWSFVDPQSHTAVHVWMPLVDVDEANGCLMAVPGSHVFTNHLSATPTNPSPYDSVRRILEEEYTEKIPMKRGSAFFYDGRLLHASNDNRTAKLRLAVGCVLVPNTVSPILHFWNKQFPEQLEIFEVTDEFLLQYEPMTEMPDPHPQAARLKSVIKYSVVPLQNADLQRLKRTDIES